MSQSNLSCGCCPNTLVPKRCNDVSVNQRILADEHGSPLTDDGGQWITLGISRSGTNFEFEFNRQIQET